MSEARKVMETARKFLAAMFVLALLWASVSFVSAEQTGRSDEDILRSSLSNIDSSIRSLRAKNLEGAISSIEKAFEDYLSLKEAHRDLIQSDPQLLALDNRVYASFIGAPEQLDNNQLSDEQKESRLRELRAGVSEFASRLGVRLSFIYEYSMFIIFALAILLSFLITLLNKRMVDWKKVKQAQAEITAWQMELREAQKKKDMKQLHKLQLDRDRILKLQSTVMSASFKPMLLYIIPYFIFWTWLSGIYSGWVVAWLPFGITLPFVGFWTSCGFLSWFLLTYFGFSSIMRRLLIGD
jgi:uncharacterized membrane protein (DUF106 family)